MLAIGGFLVLVAFWGAWLAYRQRLSNPGDRQRRWFLRTAVFSGFLPFLAIWTGWWTREVARQPWLVDGMMRIEDGVSRMTVTEATIWLVGFGIFELVVWFFTWYFMAKVIRHGPDLEAPVLRGGHEALGHLEPQPDDDEPRPAYERP